MKHLRNILVWSVLSAILIIIGLAIHRMPSHAQGIAFTGMLFLVTAGLMVRICAGSK